MPKPVDPDLADGQLDELLHRASAPETSDVDAMWTRLRRQTVDAPRRGRRVGAGVFALVGAAVAASTIYFVTRAPSSPLEAPGIYRDYETDRGMRATIELTDGSHVLLAPQSRLRIPRDFSRGNRNVELRGEAIFDVVHDTLHPFSVLAGNAKLVDLGTRFDVQAYEPATAVTVVVASGSVSVAAADSSIPAPPPVVVIAGQQASLRQGRITVGGAGRLELYFDWERGRLSFERQRLSDVLATIGRWYDLDVSVSEPRLLDRMVTAEFSTQQPMAMLDALAAAVGAKSTRDGRRVVLSPKPSR